jgi:hypothetical protein
MSKFLKLSSFLLLSLSVVLMMSLSSCFDDESSSSSISCTYPYPNTDLSMCTIYPDGISAADAATSCSAQSGTIGTSCTTSGACDYKPSTSSVYLTGDSMTEATCVAAPWNGTWLP